MVDRKDRRKRNKNDERNNIELGERQERQQRMERENRDQVQPGPNQGPIDFDRVDSYTGEPQPPEPAGDIPLDDMEVESWADETDFIPFEEETAMELLIQDADAGLDEMQDQLDDYTGDEDILDDFAERQSLNSGSDRLYERLLDHHSKGPFLSGSDIDASWESSDVSGEESVGGTSPTPDQDVVDELGNAMGLSYDDDEELETADKLEQRDRKRWELDPRSAGDLDDNEDSDDENFEANKDMDSF